MAGLHFSRACLVCNSVSIPPLPMQPSPVPQSQRRRRRNDVRPEDLAFLRQDQTKLLCQRIQELEAALRDQQQESRMWHKRLDLVPDQVLCNEYIEDKDDAHYAGKGLHWVPSPRCPLCHRIRTSLQAPMPEHAAPCPFQKLPALLSKRRRLLLKKTSDRLSTVIVYATHSGVRTLHHRYSRRRHRGGHPGTKHGDARSHHRRTVPFCATRYPHHLPLWFAPSPARHGRNGTDGKLRLVIGQELVVM